VRPVSSRAQALGGTLPCVLPECLQCGACCFSKLATYVRVTGDDHARLGEHAEHVTVFVGNRCFMRMTGEHCAALVIEPSGQFRCSVYEQRPEVCRELARGSSACAAEREQKEARTHAALHVLRDV
jgi:Fe-S-cluster containining protein